MLLHPSRIVRQGRDSEGRRVQRTYKRHDGTGRINGFEHETADGRQHAAVELPTVTAEVRPSDFGMTRRQMFDLLADLTRRFPPKPPRRTRSGLILPGEDITWH